MHLELTNREKEFCTNFVLNIGDMKKICECMYISISTAKTYLHECYRKLDIHSKYELMYYLLTKKNTR